MTEKTTAIATLDKPATFMTESGEITLNVNQIKQFVAKGSREITVAEAINFIQLCKFNALNPWIGDAYLIKFGSDPAQMVTSKYSYMKRAERAGDRYQGFKAGVVLLPKQWEAKLEETGEMPDPILMEGSITFGLDLVGGWSEILVQGKEPVRTRVSFDEYVGKTKQGEVNRQWKRQPGTMIRKVALVAGLREAFPDVFGGLYSEEEFPQAPGSGPEMSDLPPDERPLDVDPESGEIVDPQTGEIRQKETKKVQPDEKKVQPDKSETKTEKPEASTTTAPKTGRRVRRIKTEYMGKEIKTSGVTGAVLTILTNVYGRYPKAKKAIDQRLGEIGIKDMTYFRKEEGDLLLNDLAKIGIKEPESDEDRSEGEDTPESPSEEKSQEETEEAPEAPELNETSEISRNEMIPCPDRGEMEVEFSFCQDQCPKYDQKTCEHFREEASP